MVEIMGRHTGRSHGGRIGRALAVLALSALVACGGAPAPMTAGDRAALQSPSPQVVARVDAVLDARLARQQRFDRFVRAHGRRLAGREVALARKAGVTQPDRIRILEVAHIPRRDTDTKLMQNLNIQPPKLRRVEIGGLTSGYGVVLNKRYVAQDWVLAHEFAHVAQIERMGPRGFLRRVLIETYSLPGKLIPIEQEAIAISEKVTGKKAPAYHQ